MAELHDIKGIGPATAALLAEHGLSSVKKLAKAGLDAITAVPGFGPVRAAAVQAEARSAAPPEPAPSVEATNDEATNDGKGGKGKGGKGKAAKGMKTKGKKGTGKKGKEKRPGKSPTAEEIRKIPKQPKDKKKSSAGKKKVKKH